MDQNARDLMMEYFKKQPPDLLRDRAIETLKELNSVQYQYEETKRELEAFREDMKIAAGHFKVPCPQPGSDIARMFAARRQMLDQIEELRKKNQALEEAAPAKPTPMIMYCPMCKARHVDKGKFEKKLHHTHACQKCGHVWRPAIEHTVGVQFLPGFKDA
jgi:predicted RNA-binding Zn-ribbon protein involved in translation (DUF1610 family)